MLYPSFSCNLRNKLWKEEIGTKRPLLKLIMFSCLLTRFSDSLKTDITKIRSLLWGLPRCIDSIFKRNQMQKSSLRISEFYRYNKKTIQSDTKFFGLNDRYMTCDNCDRMYLISLIYYKEIYHSAITSARTENY